MKFSTVCVGDNCVDYYLPPIDRRFVGGNALNVAVHLQGCGVPTAYVGVVGDDAEGQIICSQLSQKGVDISHIHVLPGQTAHTHIQLGPQGDRNFVYEHLGPQAILSLDPQTINFIMTHRLIHTSQLGGAEQYLAQFRHSQNSLVSMDYGERSATDFITRTIGFVDLAFFSLPEELAHQAQEKASQLFNMGPRLVVITLGREGSLAFDGEVFHQAAIPVEVVDTLGAGDRYIGVFLASWLQQKPIPECMRMAAQAAALTCTHYGAWLQPNFQASLIQTDESGKLL